MSPGQSPFFMCVLQWLIRRLPLLGIWQKSIWCYYAVILLLFHTKLLSQTSYQDLYDQLDQIHFEKEKYELVLSFENHRSFSLDDQYINLLISTIDFYNKLGQPEKSFPIANTVLEFYTFGDHVDHERARKIIDKMNDYLDGVPFDSTLINYYTLSGEVNIYRSHPNKAIEDFKILIDKCRKSGDTMATNFGYAHLKLAEIYSSQWNILESDKYFRKSKEFFHDKLDTTMYLWSLSGQATLYSNNGLYHEADEVRKELIQTGQISEKYQIVAIAHLSAAMMYNDRNMPALQYRHLVQARRYLDSPSDVRDYIKIISNTLLTQYFSDQGRVDSTDYYFNKFVQFYDPEKHGPWIQEHFRIARACKTKVHKDFTQTEIIVKGLIEDVRPKNKLNLLTRLYKLLADTYSLAGDKTNAYETLVEYNQLQDSLLHIQINNQFLYYNQLFETEKKDNQIVQQKASIRLLSARNKILFWRGLLILFTISSLFLIVYLIRSYRFSQQKSRLQQRFAQNLIQEQENERQRISQELHDGISQDLILIKNTLDMKRQPEVADMVAGSLSLLRQVSRSLYPVTLQNFGLKAALEELLSRIDEAVDGLEVHHSIEDFVGVFDQQSELHIYRIVQEGTTNIIKYARCSKIEVIFHRGPVFHILEIKDNGIGIDMSDKNFYKGVGMNSLEERAKILRGALAIDSEKNRGTRITLKIPIYA